MYSEAYPYLRAKYNFDNFEQIAEAIDKHFGDLLKLDVLNDAIKQRQEGSYVDFLDMCMQSLRVYILLMK